MNRFAYRAGWYLTGGWLRVWNRLRIEARDRVPETGGVLLVSNHASYCDPPVVGGGIWRPVHFLARSSLGRFALFRWILGAVGVLFVDREGSAREGIAGAIDALASGRAVCIFPEGTRTRTGHVEQFKRGALLVLKRAPVPVVPVGIEGSWAALRRGMLLPRPVRITVRYGEPMSAAEVMAPGGVEELRRRVRVLARDVDAAAEVENAGPAAVDAAPPHGSGQHACGQHEISPEPGSTGSRGNRTASRESRTGSGTRGGSSMCRSFQTVNCSSF